MITAASAEKVARFRALHKKGAAFLFPNFWDAGSARILEGLGFPALASTSSGFALTMGRADYGVTRNEVIDHCSSVSATVSIPVAADLENGFGPSAEDCAETIRLASRSGLCGGSIEDSTGDRSAPIFETPAAVGRIVASVEAARAAPNGFVLTARAEAFLYGKADLKAVISRLQAFEDAGADVLFAPGLPDIEAVAAVCSSLSRPVNVLVLGALTRHSVEDFAKAGAARISIGGGLANSAYGALVESAADMREHGRFSTLAERPGAIKKFKQIIGG